MKFNVGNWVEVTVRRLDGPDNVMRGKIVEATRDYAVADCSGHRFVYGDDTLGYVHFRRLSGVDFAGRRAR